MYALPLDFDPGFLEGQELRTVCVGLSHVELIFVDASIVIGTDFECGLIARSDLATGLRVSGCRAAELVGTVVENALKTGRSDLRIEFEDRSHIRLFESDEPYESYQISYGKGQLVVV